MRKLLCIPLLLVLMACDYDPQAADEHTPRVNSQKYHQYFIECLDRLGNLPGRQQIKYNQEEIEGCRSSAQDMATDRNDNWRVQK